MPRFLIVVHQAVLNGCWQRLPSSDCEQVVETSSSTPSDTINSTSCGVLVGVPRPGLGMMPLMLDIAVSKLVSVSLLLLVLVSQLLSYTSSTLMLAAAAWAVAILEVSDWMVLSPALAKV